MSGLKHIFQSRDSVFQGNTPSFWFGGKRLKTGMIRLRRDASDSRPRRWFTPALEIGANALIFSVVNAIFLRPLSWRDAGRLVWPRSTSRVRGLHAMTGSPLETYSSQHASNELHTSSKSHLDGGESAVRERGSLFNHDNAELPKGGLRVRLKLCECWQRPQRRPIRNQFR